MSRCRSKIESDSGTERCERKAGHHGYHSYFVSRNRYMALRICWFYQKKRGKLTGRAQRR